MRILAALLAVALSLSLTPLAGAQSHARGRADPYVSFIDSIAAAGDTAGAMDLLEAVIARDRNSAAAWNLLGVLASAKARPARRASFMKPEHIRYIRMADSSLRRAVLLAPDNGRYSYDLARHLFGASVTTARQAIKYLEQSLASAQLAHDTVLIARVANELGMMHWRRYENVADRRGLVGVTSVSPSYLTDGREKARAFIESNTIPVKPPLGLDMHAKAVEYFRTALAVDPNNQRALRHVFMALAERKQWKALGEEATRRTREAPWDAWAWLARGLASHRLGDPRDASVAFDSAMVTLPDADRRHLLRLSRLLKKADSTKFEQLPDASRRQLERLFWITADPLTLTPGNEFLLEFLARVTYAELRWSDEDFDLRGADSDRGRIHVRYGPPEFVASFAGNTSGTASCTAGDNGEMLCDGGEAGATQPTILWYYPETNLHFIFRAPPMYGNAPLLPTYLSVAEEAREVAPVAWTNVPTIRHRIDSVAVQLSRFRAAGDSMDVVMFADVGVRQLARGFAGQAAPVDVAFTLQDVAGRMLVRDSSRQMVSPSATDAAERRAWRKRLRAGDVIYRVEALQPDSMRAARALGETSLAAAGGFGLSDILVAERVQPGLSADRWSDFVIVPSVGTFRRRQPIGLLWETYALAPSEDGSRYKVSVTLERIDRSRGARRVALRILSGVADAVGRGGEGDERASITYERQVPSRPAVADHLTLDLGELPAGAYRLTVEVLDHLSGKTTTRAREIRLVE